MTEPQQRQALYRLWIRGFEGYVSPSLCTWPATVEPAEALEGALRLAAELTYGPDGDLRLAGQIVVLKGGEAT